MITLEHCAPGARYRAHDGTIWELLYCSYTRARVQAVTGTTREIIIRDPITDEVTRRFTATSRPTKDIAPGTEVVLVDQLDTDTVSV